MITLKFSEEVGYGTVWAMLKIKCRNLQFSLFSDTVKNEKIDYHLFLSYFVLSCALISKRTKARYFGNSVTKCQRQKGSQNQFSFMYIVAKCL